MVRVVLGSGSFDWADTRLTAAVMAVLAISLVAQAVNLLIVRTFYAGGYTRIPFLVTFWGTLTTIAVTYVLHLSYASSAATYNLVEHLLRIADVPGAEVMVIAIGYSFGMVIQTTIMLVAASRLYQLPVRELALPFLRAAAAAVVGGFSAYAALNFFVFGINPESFIGVMLHGLMGGVMGVLGVILTYYVTRAPELLEISASLHGRFKKTEVVTVQDDVL
jgi:peptidoglycan biosynthesis protein MviN/MurJ (putative lipid II flippase)